MASDQKKKPVYKRWWFWVLALLLVVGLVGREDDNGNDVANDAPPPENQQPTEDTNDEVKEEPKKAPKEEPKEKIYKIGEAVKVGDVIFTVHGKSTATNVGGQFGKNSTGTYLILDVTVRNEGKEAITTGASFFKLLQGDTQYEADDSATIYANEAGKGFFFEEINPNLEKRGKIVFDVADANAAYQLQVQTGFWGTETSVIDLQ